MTSFTVGRGVQADVRLSHDTVSRLHLKVTPISDSQCLVEDLGSANGTWVLRDGQRFAIGHEPLANHLQLTLGDYPVTLTQLLNLHQQAQAGAEQPSGADHQTRDPFSRYVRTEDGRYVRKPK
ncbi:FHA domain-containing protein [Marinobacter sp. SS21]|uniref:FHA domain-containing protein n=1 Tax=Marinobacter sp. SS21 TaxID=2979460 RepID=UPI00232E035D|nr:FHA domain-containing protein [Marinobacter sp. SS21]MDC0663153.1 FHA domain-containing protein [Marinobacter sp. SS21]